MTPRQTHFSGNSRSYDEDITTADRDHERAYQRLVRDHFESLIGGEFEYYGADGAEHEFKIDDIIFRVLEDPEDGYRSCLGAIEYSRDQSQGIFFRASLGRVRLEQYDFERDSTWADEACRGYRLVDVDDGHIWLEFGTDNYNDYYPMFIFRHHPKAPE